MPDNNYVQGAEGLGENYLTANPYAPLGMLTNKFPQIDNCKFYASVQYAVNADGSQTTITPLTGNLGGDLKYYRVEVYDGQKFVAGTLDLSNRAAAFVVDTSTLINNSKWTFFFYGSEGGFVGDVGCDCEYKWEVCSPLNATGDTVPSADRWDNVKFLLKLVTSTDPAYTLFPVDGIELSRGAVINLQDYSTDSQLLDSEGYEYKLFAKKEALTPSIAIPTANTGETIATVSGNVTFPFALSTEYVDIADLVAETATAGTFSDTLTSVLTNEGVTPSITITVNTLVV